jgi:hypothetical protein
MSLQDLRVLGGRTSDSASSPWRTQDGQRYELPDSVRVDVGHFTWEDAADQYAEIVTGW